MNKLKIYQCCMNMLFSFRVMCMLAIYCEIVPFEFLCLCMSMTPWCGGFLYCNMQMLRKLSKQLSGEDWTWNNLNTLCWAIGSISGSMMEEQVKWTSWPRFKIYIISITQYAFVQPTLTFHYLYTLLVWSKYYDELS